MKKKYLECGRIVSAHGLRGDVKVQHWCDSPAYLCAFERLYFDQGVHELDIEQARVHKGAVLLKLRGVDDIEAAVALRGKVLYLDRADAPVDDGVFFQDLLGMEKYVAGVYNTGLFEFRDTAMRDTLAHIQKEEQEHGKHIYDYMEVNQMYG